ncbi:MAG: DUF5916 domain-containing protein [Bacteroidales bacterium]
MPLIARIILVLGLILGLSSYLPGQTNGVNKLKYRVGISKTTGNITVDGVLDEPDWSLAEKAVHFQRVQPTDTGFARAQTEVRLTYNDKTLFIAITCLDPTPGRRPVESLRQDFVFNKNDNFLLFMDTFNDQTNGFSFGITPAGSLWDGLQSNGAAVNLNWDAKWKADVKNYDDKWIAEFAIPFKSLRYRGGEKEWGINFSRLDLKTNEKSSWAPMPRQFATATLAYAGTLVWDNPLPSSGIRYSLIPYVSGKVTRDYQNDVKAKFTPGAGIDAKVILSTSMNLDLTVNPDYSQVEVDRQQINLDRFELFFPEKRQFYLENSDLFANLGSENIRPFFSRRIGLETPVNAGARLSGKIGKNWRLGIMDIQTGEKDRVPAANYSVATIQRKVFSRSNISAFIINKQVTGDTTGDIQHNAYNRVAGLEYNLASPDNKWTGKAFYHHSFYGNSSNNDASSASLTYSTQYLTAQLAQSWVGKGYISETGYIRRKGFFEMAPSFQYKFFPRSGSLVSHGPGFRLDYYWDPDFEITDRDNQLLYLFEWKNRSTLTLDFRNTFILLQAAFDPTNTGGTTLAAGSDFSWNEGGATYMSDARKTFNYTLTARYGGFYNGKRLSLNSEINYRFQPYGNISLVTTYYGVSLPEPYNSANLFLVGPRVDITFTNKLYLTSFVQYNSQVDNLNMNIRFQWRFAPVSDLFLVYTENTYPWFHDVKNRGLVLKLSYWFN